VKCYWSIEHDGVLPRSSTSSSPTSSASIPSEAHTHKIVIRRVGVSPPFCCCCGRRGCSRAGRSGDGGFEFRILFYPPFLPPFGSPVTFGALIARLCWLKLIQGSVSPLGVVGCGEGGGGVIPLLRSRDRFHLFSCAYCAVSSVLWVA